MPTMSYKEGVKVKYLMWEPTLSRGDIFIKLNYVFYNLVGRPIPYEGT